MGHSGHHPVGSGIHPASTDGGALMDPVVLLLLFNVAVWCYWTFK
jgi:hypothetical protein